MSIEDKIGKTLDLLRTRSIKEFEIFSSLIDTTRTESKQGEVSSLERCSESGLGLRIITNGSMGFSYSAQPSNELIDAAIQSAKNQSQDLNHNIPTKCGSYTEVSAYDRAVQDARVEDCINRAVQLERASRETDPRIAQVRKASYAKAIAHRRIVNSHGIDISNISTHVQASIMAMARDGADTQAGFDFDLSHYWDGLDIEQVGRHAALQAIEMLGARHMQTKKIPILLPNTVAAEILNFMGDAFLGENVIKSKSFLANKLGKKVFSSLVTMLDNPLDIRAKDAVGFDGEGLPSKRTVLVNQGVIEGFAYDTYWGRVANKSSTGNSVRTGYRDLPVLGIRHLCLMPHNDTLTQEVENFKEVLKITEIMGMHTADPISGEFSIGISGVLLKRGISIHPVREAAISGNILELFSKVIAIGADEREFGHVLTPSFLIDAMDVSAK